MRETFVWRALAEARWRTGRRLVLKRRPTGWYLCEGPVLLRSEITGERMEAHLAAMRNPTAYTLS